MIEIEELENKPADEILSWSLEKFYPKISLASSFGAEDVVLIDMMSKIRNDFRVFTLDTGRLPQETYDVMDQIRQKYNISIEVMFPETLSVEKMVKEHGLNLFYQSIDSRKLCCGIRKVEPLNRMLSELNAWISGLRRDQTQTRTKIQKVEKDDDHGGIFKINPLADWSWEKVMNYVKDNNIPYNKLHDEGYPSIGCLPCTRAVKPGENPRAGRWWWELDKQKECGLHVG